MKALLLLALLAVCWVSGVRADNAVPVASGTLGAYRVTVFGHPAPLRAGPSRIEWLVQDPSGRMLDARDWKVSLQPPEAGGEAWVPPCCRMTAQSEGDLPSGRRGFLRTSDMVFNTSGTWTFQISEPSLGVLALPLEVGEPVSPWFQFWPWFLAPTAAVALTAINAWLLRRRPRG